jgi:hypothetical protein
VAVVIATLHLLGPLTQYLFFRPLVDAANAIVRRVSFPVIDGVIATGAFIIGGGNPAVIETPNPRYATTAALTAAAYVIGFALVSSAITGIWSLLDRGAAYASLGSRLRVYARYLLAATMLIYAMAKVIPTQFGFIAPGDLIRPLGQFSRFDFLWTFMALSTGYTIFVGAIELLAAFLLLSARTTLVGALLAAAALTNVIALDIAYDVRGPLVIAVLMLFLAAVVLVPFARPLWTFLLSVSVTAEDRRPTRRLLLRSKYALVPKAVAVVWMVGILVHTGVGRRTTFFGSGVPVYGLFDVETLAIDDAARTRADAQVWRLAGHVGRSDNKSLGVQLATGDWRRFRLEDDTSQRLWTLYQQTTEVARLRYETEPDGAILLSGQLERTPVKMRLRPVEASRYPLVGWR